MTDPIDVVVNAIEDMFPPIGDGYDLKLFNKVKEVLYPLITQQPNYPIERAADHFAKLLHLTEEERDKYIIFSILNTAFMTSSGHLKELIQRFLDELVAKHNLVHVLIQSIDELGDLYVPTFHDNNDRIYTSQVLKRSVKDCIPILIDVDEQVDFCHDDGIEAQSLMNDAIQDVVDDLKGIKTVTKNPCASIHFSVDHQGKPISVEQYHIMRLIKQLRQFKNLRQANGGEPSRREIMDYITIDETEPNKRVMGELYFAQNILTKLVTGDYMFKVEEDTNNLIKLIEVKQVAMYLAKSIINLMKARIPNQTFTIDPLVDCLLIINKQPFRNYYHQFKDKET